MLNKIGPHRLALESLRAKLKESCHISEADIKENLGQLRDCSAHSSFRDREIHFWTTASEVGIEFQARCAVLVQSKCRGAKIKSTVSFLKAYASS